jgi:cysteine desulfurase
MLANNETGVVQDDAALAEAAKPGRGWFHSDAVQALGKLPVDFRALNARGVHALTVSAHKIGGPKGAGALVLDKRVELKPLISAVTERGLLRHRERAGHRRFRYCLRAGRRRPGRERATPARLARNT